MTNTRLSADGDDSTIPTSRTGSDEVERGRAPDLASVGDEGREIVGQLVQQMADGVVVVDDDGRILFGNLAATRILGTDCWDSVRLPLPSQPDQAVVHELSYAKPDGTSIVIEAHVAPVRWHGASRRLATLRDVTADRAAAARLRAQARMLDVIGQAVIVTDLGWRITHWNDQAERQFGWRADEKRGQHLDRIAPPDSDSQGLFEAISSGRTWMIESEAPRKDGTRVPVAVTYSALTDVDGALIGYIAVATDFTPTLRHQQALRTSERRFRSMLERLHLVALILDPDGRITFCNDSVLNLTGWRREDLIGGDLFDLLLPEETRERFRSVFQDAVTSDSPTAHFTTSIVTRTRERLEIEWSTSLLHEPDGRVSAVACVGENVTARARAEAERKRLEDQLFQIQKMESVGTLAGGLAHDFNNILAAIMSHGSLVAMSLPKDSPVADSVRAIIDSCDRGADLTKQLLNIARSGKREVKPTDPNDIVQDVLRLIRETFDRAIEIRTDLVERPWRITVDSGQIHQTLTNICINARDAMPGGGVLTVRTENASVDSPYSRRHHGLKPGRYVCISVEDTGSGMTEAVRARIFDPFYSTKRHGIGTGLGLATSYGIVRNHDGQIQVYSEPGKGSLFKVYLPAIGGRVRSAASTHDQTSEVPKGNETVLLVDDEEAIRQVGEAVLGRLGYRVLLASDGIEASEVYRSRSDEIGLVITDMVMPRQSGRDLVRELRSINPECRILVSSGFSLNEDINGALSEGAAGFIQKPFTVRALASAIRDAIDRRPTGLDSAEPATSH